MQCTNNLKQIGLSRKEQYLPEKYNAKSTIEKLVVENGKTKIERDFELK